MPRTRSRFSFPQKNCVSARKMSGRTAGLSYLTSPSEETTVRMTAGESQALTRKVYRLPDGQQQVGKRDQGCFDPSVQRSRHVTVMHLL